MTDCAIAAPNAATAADGLGLGSCCIGDIIVQENAYRRTGAEKLRETLVPRAGRRPYGEWLKAFCDRKYQSGFAREMNRSVEEYLKVLRNE